MRTGTSLISFGYTIYKFFQEYHKVQAVVPSSLLGAREFGLIMISIGLITTLVATIQHRQTLKNLRDQYEGLPYSLAFLVALLISVLGLLALLAVFFR